MTKPNWTEGEWRVHDWREDEEGGNAVHITTSDADWTFSTEEHIATMRYADNQIANAHLIAASPRLYGEAEFLLDRLYEWSNENLTDDGSRDWMGHVEPAIARLRAALRAARGEET